MEMNETPTVSMTFKDERAEVERVLGHPEISRSASLVRFLSFICNKYFDGESEEIREYSIAVEALGRKESTFDSHVDPIVRVTARSLRKKLREFYENEGREHALQIHLPLGHYVPEFKRRSELESGSDSVVGVAISDANQEEKLIVQKIFFFLKAHGGLGEGEKSAAVSRLRGISWKKVLIGGSAMLLVAAIFITGFVLGRHTDEHSSLNNEAFRWGDPEWSDEFDGAALQLPDPSKWGYDIGNQAGWGNHELQTYCSPNSEGLKECDPRKPNAFLDGAGHLVIRALKGPTGAWTSARITTRGLRDFQYGRIEARMKFPVGAGLWPSFWLLGANFATAGWPASGSVDIAENVSLTARTNGLGPTMIRSTLHGPRYYGGNGLWNDYKLPNGARVDDGSFHTYGEIWSPGMIQFYVDDPANIIYVQDASHVPEGGEWVFEHPFYLLMNLALGGDWPGNPDGTTPNPADLLVDYVRVYKIPTVSAPSIQWQPVQVKAGSSVASSISLRARTSSGRVYLSCTTEPVTVGCALATSVVDFTHTLSQEDTVTITTDTFTNGGKVVSSPGRYKLMITATTISGDRSKLTVPFEVTGAE